MFESMRVSLDRKKKVERAGFTVADAFFYERWMADNPEFERQGHLLLKEWEVTAARNGKPDLELLRRYERELGAEAGLFGAIVADRRLFMGPDCTYSQDYRRRFSDDELLYILQNGLIAVERMFDELKPGLVVGFICVSMLEYLVYLFARSRGVRILNLRPTRIGDRITFGSLLNDPTPEFIATYRRVCADGSRWMDDARRYIKRVREEHGRYEGAVKPSAKPAMSVNRKRAPALVSATSVLRNYRRYRAGAARTDNHVPNPLRAVFFAAAVNPVRALSTARLLKDRYITARGLSETPYVFYPLHTEPEVSLLVYGRPFVNQIEVIRQLAMSLPIGTILVVKEHPWMVGKRTQDAYRKLLEIPRVHLAKPDTDARELIAGAALIAVITGSIALEAAILGKPVITFGDCPYNALPPTMVRRCQDLRRLPMFIGEVMRDHRNDERALEAYVAATFEVSESVSLYSVLLNKQGVHVERDASYGEEIEKLATYALTRLQESDDPPGDPGAADW
jgi:hypothetical protein